MPVNRSIAISLLVVVFAIGAAAQQVPVVGAQGATLDRLVDSPTLVTVVLEVEGPDGDVRTAEHANVRITDVHENGITVTTQKNEPIPYLYENIKEIQVQGGKVQEREFDLSKTRVLRAEEQDVVDQALDRAKSIFQTANDNQDRKMRAATLLAVAGQQEAEDYLNNLLETNSIEAQIKAAVQVYLSGGSIPVGLIQAAFDSSIRSVRRDGIFLAGIANYEPAIPLLKEMLPVRSEEFAAPAARALARMGVREVIPQLINMVESPNQQKGEAAVWALAQLGNGEIGEQLAMRLENADGLARFRIIKLLFQLGTEEGEARLKDVFQNVVTQKLGAARMLARDGYWDATVYLREQIEERTSQDPESQIRLARTAAALLESGDPSARAVFQRILRGDQPEPKIEVAELILQIGNPRLLPLLQSSIVGQNPDVALKACTAAVALAEPEFRERSLKLQTATEDE